LTKDTEFIVQVNPKKKIEDNKEVPFLITPEKIESIRKGTSKHLPKFKISGKLYSVLCDISRPLAGEIIIEECDAPIRSIEVQLVRVETCGSNDGFAKEATEVQNIQVAEGDPPRNVPVSIHMIFPRLFTCPSIATKTFKVEFAVNLVVMLEDGHLISENFPIKLIRKADSFDY